MPLYDLVGAPADAGFTYGQAVRSLLTAPFRERYLESVGRCTRTTRTDLSSQAHRWLARLPVAHQLEIEGMAAGARVSTPAVAEFLYADIARASDGAGDSAGNSTSEAVDTGPLCSAAAGGEDSTVWIARNCDWLFTTLQRGVAAVVHRTPHRIPVLAVGIQGDIDVDTGLNAEGLWLHLHTLHSIDAVPPDRTCISWLFWAREALETCADLQELERFIEGTTRDRGVLVIAADGKSGDAAIFECGRASHRRIDRVGPFLAATNHSPDKSIDAERARIARSGSSVARYCALRERLSAQTPSRLPEDLVRLLADPAVEMRTPTHLRTIYSAVAEPARGNLWFAAGDATGRPAASTGTWARVPIPF